MDANCLIFKLFGLFFANIFKTAAKLRLKIRKSKQFLTKITLFKKKNNPLTTHNTQSILNNGFI